MVGIFPHLYFLMWIEISCARNKLKPKILIDPYQNGSGHVLQNPVFLNAFPPLGVCWTQSQANVELLGASSVSLLRGSFPCFDVWNSPWLSCCIFFAECQEAGTTGQQKQGTLLCLVWPSDSQAEHGMRGMAHKRATCDSSQGDVLENLPPREWSVPTRAEAVHLLTSFCWVPCVCPLCRTCGSREPYTPRRTNYLEF